MTCTPRSARVTKGLTGDPAKILQGDDFLRQVVPAIMASEAYKNRGVIVIWFDESESDGVTGDPGGRLQPYDSGNHHFRPRPQKTSAASPTPAQ